ncbi:hypothetical protein HaLaN_21134, partial [Haematococcus lacustris]
MHIASEAPAKSKERWDVLACKTVTSDRPLQEQAYGFSPARHGLTADSSYGSNHFSCGSAEQEPKQVPDMPRASPLHM